jgi:hypothetical protein
MADEDVNIHIHVHTGSSADDQAKLDQILIGVSDLQQKGDIMAADLTGLVNEVAEARTVADSAVALINGFGAQLDAAIAAAEGNAVDVATLEELRSALDASNADLTAAITDNTPEAEPDPQPEPDPVPEPAPVDPPVDENPV